MRRRLPMTKNFTDMTHNERMAALMRELRSPKGVATAIALIEQAKHELKEFEQGLEIALQIQGAGVPFSHLQTEAPRTEVDVPLADSRKTKRRTAGGTLASLVERYRSHPQSNYSTLRHKTRENYEGLIRRILKEYGDRNLADLKAPDIQDIFDGWSEGGKLAMAHSLITMLRNLVNFGATKLEDDDCIHLAVVLHRMSLPGGRPEPREGITEDQVRRIISHANERGFGSIGLAQAIQFECALWQKDVIGEWAPMSEPGMPSDIIDDENGTKWLRGIRWTQVDDNLILRHVTSKMQESVEVDLKRASLVMKQMKTMFRLGEVVTRANLPANGAVIICERTNRPWTAHYFRQRWREIAKAAGVPNKVTNVGTMKQEETQQRPAEVRSAGR